MFGYGSTNLKSVFDVRFGLPQLGRCEVPMIYSQWPSIDFVRRLLIAASWCCDRRAKCAV